MRRYAIAALCGIAACGGSTEPKTPTARQFEVDNYLATNVVLVVDGTTVGSVPAAAGSPSSTVITIASNAKSITYTPSKAQPPGGGAYPDDVGSETLALTADAQSLSINNIIAGTPYFTPILVNQTGLAVDMAVVQPTGTECLGTVTPVSIFTPVRFGYYRLTPTTEVRAYHGGTGCTGAYSYWPYSLLSQYQVNSGVASLALASLP